MSDEATITQPPLLEIDDDFDTDTTRKKFDEIFVRMNALYQEKTGSNRRKILADIYLKEYLPLLSSVFVVRPGKKLQRLMIGSKGEYTDKMIAVCINSVFTENVKALFGRVFAEIYNCASGIKVYASRSDTETLKNVSLKIFIAPAKEAQKSKAGKWPVYMLEADMLNPQAETDISVIDYALYESEIALARHERAQD